MQMTDLHPRVSSLRRYQHLVEPQFTSSLPTIGPVLVRVRRAWNWMSTKWYVRPIVEQQNAFNETVVDAIAELGDALKDQVAENRQALRDIGGKLNTWEGSAVQSERAVVGFMRDLALLEARFQRIEDRLDRIDEALRALVDEKSANQRS